MNRQQRRKAARDGRREMLRAKADFDRDVRRDGIFDASRAVRDPGYMANAVDQRRRQKENWSKNGITEADLKAEYQRGYASARKDLVDFAMSSFYASIAIALHRRHGFDEDQITDVLDDVQQIMTEEITVHDLVNRCREETGLEIVQAVEEGYL